MAIPSSAHRVRGAPAPRTLSAEIDWGLGYEGLVGLAMFIGGESEHSYEVGPQWFQAVRRKSSAKLRDTAKKAFGTGGHVLLGLSGLLHDARGRDLGALAEVVEQSDPAGIRRALLHCDPLLRDRLLAGEDKALAEYLNQFTSKAERASALKLLEADAKSLAADTVELIRRWDNEVFSDLGPPIEAELRTAAHAAQRLINQVPVDRLIVRLTRGVEYRAEPWISKVILIPSVLSRPWVDISEYRDARIFFYPAAAESALPDVQLVDVYKALGDETRLRILRLMGEGVTGLTEIAERLGLAKSTVHGHMVILRSSGLTRSVVGVDGKGYVLNDRPDLNALLDGYLKS